MAAARPRPGPPAWHPYPPTSAPAPASRPTDRHRPDTTTRQGHPRLGHIPSIGASSANPASARERPAGHRPTDRSATGRHPLFAAPVTVPPDTSPGDQPVAFLGRPPDDIHRSGQEFWADTLSDRRWSTLSTAHPPEGGRQMRSAWSSGHSELADLGNGSHRCATCTRRPDSAICANLATAGRSPSVTTPDPGSTVASGHIPAAACKTPPTPNSRVPRPR